MIYLSFTGRKMKNKYRGECGQCDFVANSAMKMEQHLRTHGIYLSGSAPEDEPPKPQPRRRKRGKRIGYQPKVKTELKDQIDTSSQSSEVHDEPSVKNEVEEDTEPEEGASNDNCHLLYTEGMPSHNEVEIKAENIQVKTEEISDNVSHEVVMTDVPLSSESPPSTGTGLDLVAVKNEVTDVNQNISDIPLENEESELNLTLSCSDTSNNSINATNELEDSSTTLSAIESDVPFDIRRLTIKKELTDSSYSSAEQRMLSTPSSHGSPPCVSVTPPDHDYIKVPQESEEDCIPDSLKEEFMMNCVSIKQEEFEQMGSPNSCAESKVIVIAPQGDQNQMNELCSFIEANSNPPRDEYLDSNENINSGTILGTAGSEYATQEIPTDAAKATKLIRTSVLRSILRGEVAPPSTPVKESSEPKQLKGRKMYSLPCTFTRDGKLRLVPAASDLVTHYIVVAPATPGNSPCLYLVAKAKVQNMIPPSEVAPKPKNKAKKSSVKTVKRQLCPPSPSNNLKKARTKLDNVLAEVKPPEIKNSPEVKNCTEIKNCAEIKNCTKIPSPYSVSNALMRKIAHSVVPQVPVVSEENSTEKIFICRKKFCSFSTKQYYSYQSHVMRCWENHGFLVCDLEFCGGLYRTKSIEEFEQHCMNQHNCLMLHSCSKCMFLGTHDSHIHQHYAMYHRDLYAPESPFPLKAFPTQRLPKRDPVKKEKDNNARVTTVLVAKPPLTPSYSSSPNPGVVEPSENAVSLSLRQGMAGMTNAKKYVSPIANDVAKSPTLPPGRISVTIGPTHIQGPQQVQCSERTAKMVKDLISQIPKPSAIDVKEVCYSAKQLEETLEPATKVLTQTVKSKCLRDIEHSIQKNSPTKDVHVHIYVTDPPGVEAKIGKDKNMHSKIKKEPGTENEVSERMSDQARQTFAQNFTQGGQKTPEKSNQLESEIEDEYLDGTVDESFSYDDLEHNTAQGIFVDKSNGGDSVNAQNEGQVITNSSPSKDSVSSAQPMADSLHSQAQECTPSPQPKQGPLLQKSKDGASSHQPDCLSTQPSPQPGEHTFPTILKVLLNSKSSADPQLRGSTESLLGKESSVSPQATKLTDCAKSPTSDEGGVKRLILEDEKGDKSEVLLQPSTVPPTQRHSGRPRKRKDFECNQSCCVNNKKKRRKVKQKTEVVNFDANMDVKLLSKPVVVLIDIMRLVRPMLGLDSPVRESPVRYSRKQTARKSTAKRTRRVKRTVWSRDYYFY